MKLGAALFFLTLPSVVLASDLTLGWQNQASYSTITVERRSSTSNTWLVFTSLPGTTTNWRNTGIPNGRTYCYRLRATDTNGQAIPGYSNEACGTAN